MFGNIPMFADLPQEALDALSARATRRKYPKNAVLITEGDHSDSLYVIESGRVKVHLNDEEGREVVLSFLGPGEYFGELALLDDSPRSASVMTMEPTSVCMISKSDFDQYVLNNPTMALKLLRAQAQQIRALTDSVRDLALSEVYERVARLLQRLAIDQHGKQVVPQRLTHQEIANMVGASREMVSRILKDLTTGDYISIEDKVVTLNRKLPDKW